MKHIINPVSIFLLALTMTSLFSDKPVWSEIVREPAYAGSFYPADKDELLRMIEDLTKKAKQTSFSAPDGKTLKALILPHAGYIYSGFAAAHACHVLSENQFENVILMGPDHRVGFTGISITNANSFKTPLGRIAISEKSKNLAKKSDLFAHVSMSDQQEHSLEVILPFLQYCLKSFKLLPLVMGDLNIDESARAIENVNDDKTLLVASSDLSHYLPYQDAVNTDKDTIDMILRLDYTAFLQNDRRACGKMPILVLIDLAKKYGWKPCLIHYSNSGDTAGSYDRVVGYAAIAFFGESIMKKADNKDAGFSKEHGQMLVLLARQTINKELGEKVQSDKSLEASLKSQEFQVRRGTFVTLKKKGQLRGCIGSLTGHEPVADGVRHNAINAAFHDPRFKPLSKNELNQIEIEVSILSDPTPLEYNGADDLIARLRVNIDGVIIRKGYQSATFLPQVWEQLPDPKDFLSHLCMKAGMPSDAWRKTKLEVSTYQVEYFEEE